MQTGAREQRATAWKFMSIPVETHPNCHRYPSIDWSSKLAVRSMRQMKSPRPVPRVLGQPLRETMWLGCHRRRHKFTPYYLRREENKIYYAMVFLVIESMGFGTAVSLRSVPTKNSGGLFNFYYRSLGPQFPQTVWTRSAENRMPLTRLGG